MHEFLIVIPVSVWSRGLRPIHRLPYLRRVCHADLNAMAGIRSLRSVVLPNFGCKSYGLDSGLLVIGLQTMALLLREMRQVF
jgi:hypothetical protein